MIICDTNIFIHLFNGDQPTINLVNIIGLDEICISSVTLMELYRGMGNKNEMQRMKRFNIVAFDERISALASDFILDYKLSHDLKIPDAIIGATSAIYNFELLTYNTKDF